MKGFKAALSVAALAVGFALTTSVQAMPISLFSSSNPAYVSALNSGEGKATVWKNYKEPKKVNVALESLTTDLKKTSFQKDDLVKVLGLASSYLSSLLNTSYEINLENLSGDKVKTSKVPEPSSILLLGLGMLGIFGLRKKRV